MGIGGSVFLIAIGAILTFAIETDSAEGFNINTIGVILMVVGGIGVLAFVTAVGLMTPSLLLALTFGLGIASAVQLPAYQAIVPEIVPERGGRMTRLQFRGTEVLTSAL